MVNVENVVKDIYGQWLNCMYIYRNKTQTILTRDFVMTYNLRSRVVQPETRLVSHGFATTCDQLSSDTSPDVCRCRDTRTLLTNIDAMPITAFIDCNTHSLA